MRRTLAVRFVTLAVLQLVLVVAVFELGGVIATGANGGPPGAEVSVYDENDRLIASTADPPLRVDSDHTRVEPTPVSGRPGRIIVRGGRFSHHRVPLLTPGNTLFVGGLVILVIGSFLTARGIVRPLRELADVARALGEGNLRVRTGLRRADEIGDVARAFNDMGARIERLRLAEKELLANVSHELRTPLTRIRVALDIAGEANPEVLRSSLAEIGIDLSELESLVEDIFTATRLDIQQGTSREAHLELHVEETSALVVCDSAADRFRARHPARPFAVEADEDLPMIEVDPVLFRRMLDNLLENAHKYSPDPESAITLRAAGCPDGSIAFVVEDHGMGIAEGDLPRLFEPFFRADRTRARGTGGVGLGLSLAKRIVEAHGGTIRVESVPGRGSNFRASVPHAGWNAGSAAQAPQQQT
jgi:two-component system OmpR family sensor kinase